MRRTAVRVAWALALLGLAGCYRSAVRGEVVDFDEETLPGVAVSVEGTAFQDVTNGVGRYSVRYYPGAVRLHFSKTGYTPALLDLKAEGLWPVDAPKVTLWRLPQNRGVFFLEDTHYLPTEPVEPRAFANRIYGTEKWPETVTTNPHPRLIAHRLPAEGATLVRMKFVEAMPESAEAREPTEVWAPDAAIPVAPTVIDRPEGLLVDIRYDGPLAPGTYAVHWGALTGSREPVPSMYMFSVESDAPPAKAEEPEGEEADEKNDEGNKEPAKVEGEKKEGSEE